MDELLVTAKLIALCFILAYLIGSIPFSQLIARWRSKADLRVDGYRNVGAYNVVKTTGIGWGFLAGFLDACKGVVVLVVVRALGGSYPWYELAGLCAMLGHNYPIWLGFRGGKGVMVLAGLLLWTIPLETLVAVAVAFLVFWWVRLVNVSVTTGLIVIIVLALFFDQFESIQMFLFGGVALIGITYLPRFARWLSSKGYLVHGGQNS